MQNPHRIALPVLIAALALSLARCGDDESLSPDPGRPAATDATPPTATTQEAPGPAHITFIDGFAAGAARAKPGDVLLVYVGQHDPT